MVGPPPHEWTARCAEHTLTMRARQESGPAHGDTLSMTALSRFAFDPADPDERRDEKLAILIVAGSCCVAGTVWAAMYVYFFGIGLGVSLKL